MIVLFYLFFYSQIAGGGGWHASFVNAATTAARKLETPMTKAYWETLLPGTSMPPAIRDLLGQQNGLPLPSLCTVIFLFHAIAMSTYNHSK
jgi:hypothetical protein